MTTTATTRTRGIAKRKSRFFAMAERLGLVGCISGPPDLAQTIRHGRDCGQM